MAKNWKSYVIPEEYIAWISNVATLGGIVLGFFSLAEAIRDQESPAWAIFCLAVGYFSGAKLLDEVIQHFGPASMSRAVVMSFIIVLFALLAMLIGFFAFAR